jgi:hypothetical protein
VRQFHDQAVRAALGIRQQSSPLSNAQLEPRQERTPDTDWTGALLLQELHIHEQAVEEDGNPARSHIRSTPIYSQAIVARYLILAVKFLPKVPLAED